MEDKNAFLKENWYWAVLFFGLLGVGLYGMFRPGAGEKVSTPEEQDARVLAAKLANAQAMPERQEPVPREVKTQATIDEHLKKVEENPQSPDSPAFLCAAANLQRMKLGDTQGAIALYERCLREYPDWEGINRAYCNLANCYEQLGDTQNERWVYQKMFDKFPEDSQEHLFAKQELGLP